MLSRNASLEMPYYITLQYFTVYAKNSQLTKFDLKMNVDADICRNWDLKQLFKVKSTICFSIEVDINDS